MNIMRSVARSRVQRGPGSSPIRILVVDDEPLSARAIQRLFETRGLEVVTACDGADALARLRADGPYALVLSDVEMPRMNGIELLERVRAEIHIPVVLMSGGGIEDLPWRSADHGDGFVPKPIDFNAALETIFGAILRVQKG